MTQFRSIIDTHNQMIRVIPENQKHLITDLTNFINKLETTTKKYLTSKQVYTSYLQVLLAHMPNRPLKNADPLWMWNCQEVFSYSTIN
jgi:hypothetical protein